MMLMSKEKSTSFLCGGIGKMVRPFFTITTDFELRQIFPSYSSARRPVNKNSALAKIREKRSAMKAQEANTENSV
jgi:hypothetical protein